MQADQSRRVLREFKQLLGECEDFEDAMQYLDDIADDNELDVEDVEDVIRTVYGRVRP